MNKYIYLRPTNSIRVLKNRLSLSNKAYLIWNKVRAKGVNNIINVEGSGKLRHCNISIKGKNNIITIKNGANISHSQLEIVGNNCNITIGENTDIGGAYLSSKGNNTKLSIGSGCMLSRNINVMTYDGHPVYDKSTKKQINPPQSIIIKDNVWIAANASILKGVTVESGSIIGFGSIVTNDVPANSISAGIPAKKIKENIYWEH